MCCSLKGEDDSGEDEGDSMDRGDGIDGDLSPRPRPAPVRSYYLFE